MRVDKFLKISRLVKRRTLAKEICDQGRVKLNQKPCKASTIIQLGDQLSIRYGQKELTVLVEELRQSASKEQATSLYRVLKEDII